MNPIGIINNDLSTLKMASEKLFEVWKDKVAEDMKHHCTDKIQQDWNACLQELNLRMNIFMRAEKKIDDKMSRFEKEFKQR